VGKCCVYSLGGLEVIEKEHVGESLIRKDKGQHQAIQTSPYEQQKYRQIVNDEKEVTSMFMDVVLSVADLIQQKFTSIEMLTEEAMYFKVGFKVQYGKKVLGRIGRMNNGTLVHVEHNQIKTEVACTASVSKKRMVWDSFQKLRELLDQFGINALLNGMIPKNVMWCLLLQLKMLNLRVKGQREKDLLLL